MAHHEKCGEDSQCRARHVEHFMKAERRAESAVRAAFGYERVARRGAYALANAVDHACKENSGPGYCEDQRELV